MTRRVPRIHPLGDAAVLVEFGRVVDLQVSRRVHGLAARVVAVTAGEPGWGVPVPGACSLLVPVDPLEPGAVAAAARLAKIVRGFRPGAGHVDAPGAAPSDALQSETSEAPGQVLKIRTRYGGPDGPDLAAVAEMTGLTLHEVVQRHAAVLYTTLFLGFAPGFGYLGPLPDALALPRRPVPRTHVPAGSVAIVGGQTAVYPIDSPGGWWVIGRTELSLWDPRRDPPALLRAGTRVRFLPEPGSP